LLDLRLGRWRCRNEKCGRKTFVERLPSVATPMGRRTVRVAEIVRLFGHAAGGLPSERLLARLAMLVSDSAILRQLKRHVRERGDPASLRAIAIDDWSWRKGFTYGTIVVDLERRVVADVLGTRSVEETADWLERRPEIEIMSRDRCGLYVQGIRQGAPQVRQVADRFHLLQNLRESIERQMTAVSCFPGRSRLPSIPGDRQSVLRRRSRDARERMFEQAKDLHASGKSFVAIAAEIGVGHRTIAKWVEADSLPHRRRLTLNPSSPLYFQEFLARRWAEGDKVGRRLFHDIRHRRYTGSFSHLERLLSEWRRAERPETSSRREPTRESRAVDPATGWQISPVVAAALCMKPTRMLTHSQAAKVAVLKEASPSFVVMRQLAMRFRGLLRSADPGKLGSWLDDARHSGIRPLQQFARTLSRDIDAVRNAVAEPWSSGQAEGQINRLKTLKRAMFGRAGIELLRARMLPIE
jgi:transposase